MATAVIILLLLALLFGVGAIVKGLLWLGLIALLLIVVGIALGLNRGS